MRTAHWPLWTEFTSLKALAASPPSGLEHRAILLPLLLRALMHWHFSQRASETVGGPEEGNQGRTGVKKKDQVGATRGTRTWYGRGTWWLKDKRKQKMESLEKLRMQTSRKNTEDWNDLLSSWVLFFFPSLLYFLFFVSLLLHYSMWDTPTHALPGRGRKGWLDGGEGGRC